MVAYSFKAQFRAPILAGTKRQTLRGPRRRHARVGEETQLYTGMRTRHCKLIDTSTCDRFEGVNLKWSEWRSFCLFDVMEREPGVWRRVGDMRPIADLDTFARSDGFTDFDDMARFWSVMHGPETFEGFLIGWAPLSTKQHNGEGR